MGVWEYGRVGVFRTGRPYAHTPTLPYVGGLSALPLSGGEQGIAAYEKISAYATDHTSNAYAEAGYFVMRSGWQPWDATLVFDCGPLGAGSAAHGHADALSFQFFAAGYPYFVDSGTYCYNLDYAWRDAFRGTRAHNTIVTFLDAATWLAQIAMFVLLGLLAWPERFPQRLLPALAVALVLMLIARPAAVLVCLAPFRFSLREKLFISWVGLRGAVSVFLASIPMLVGLPGAHFYFDVLTVNALHRSGELHRVARVVRYTQADRHFLDDRVRTGPVGDESAHEAVRREDVHEDVFRAARASKVGVVVHVLKVP